METGEELLLAGYSGGSGADRTLERDPRSFPPFAPPVFSFSARAGRRGRSGRRCRAPLPVPFLGSPARLADPVALLRQPGACRRPGGPASQRYGCGHRRGGPRPSGQRRRLDRKVRARCSAIPPGCTVLSQGGQAGPGSTGERGGWETFRIVPGDAGSSPAPSGAESSLT